MQTLFNRMGRHWQGGTLEFVLPDGRIWRIGKGEPIVPVQVHDPGMVWRLLRHPRLAFGETYMEGLWDPVGGNMAEILKMCAHNIDRQRSGIWGADWLQKIFGSRRDLHTQARAKENVRHHYDVDYNVYKRFLDQDLHYSCAYFQAPDDALELAQQAKCAHIAAKLDLRPNATVLDIGCGWGSLAMYLAEQHGVQCTGITLSEEQLKVARSRARDRGLESEVNFKLLDYRDITGEFDAIVSVGMFEHVGRPQYDLFFERVRDLLVSDGVALLHTIGRYSATGGADPWIRKYIFPGGYVPSAAEVLNAVEKSGLVSCDLEFLRGHYALTLDHWHERFRAARADVVKDLGEHFCRMWEFYLQACAACFRYSDLAVFQLQLSRGSSRLSLTRDYIYHTGAA